MTFVSCRLCLCLACPAQEAWVTSKRQGHKETTRQQGVSGCVCPGPGCCGWKRHVFSGCCSVPPAPLASLATLPLLPLHTTFSLHMRVYLGVCACACPPRRFWSERREQSHQIRSFVSVSSPFFSSLSLPSRFLIITPPPLLHLLFSHYHPPTPLHFLSFLSFLTNQPCPDTFLSARLLATARRYLFVSALHSSLCKSKNKKTAFTHSLTHSLTYDPYSQ